MTLTLPEIRLTERELKQELAISLYAGRKVTLIQAADIAGVGLFEFQAWLRDRQIPQHYGERDLEKDLQFFSTNLNDCSLPTPRWFLNLCRCAARTFGHSKDRFGKTGDGRGILGRDRFENPRFTIGRRIISCSLTKSKFTRKAGHGGKGCVAFHREALYHQRRAERRQRRARRQRHPAGRPRPEQSHPAVLRAAPDRPRRRGRHGQGHGRPRGQRFDRQSSLRHARLAAQGHHAALRRQKCEAEDEEDEDGRKAAAHQRAPAIGHFRSAQRRAWRRKLI